MDKETFNKLNIFLILLFLFLVLVAFSYQSSKRSPENTQPANKKAAVTDDFKLTDKCLLQNLIPQLEHAKRTTCDFSTLSGYSVMNVLVLDRFDKAKNKKFYKFRIFQIANGKDLKSISGVNDLKLVYEERIPFGNQYYENEEAAAIVNQRPNQGENVLSGPQILVYNSKTIDWIGFPFHSPQGYGVNWKK